MITMVHRISATVVVANNTGIMDGSEQNLSMCGIPLGQYSAAVQAGHKTYTNKGVTCEGCLK